SFSLVSSAASRESRPSSISLPRCRCRLPSRESRPSANAKSPRPASHPLPPPRPRPPVLAASSPPPMPFQNDDQCHSAHAIELWCDLRLLVVDVADEVSLLLLLLLVVGDLRRLEVVVVRLRLFRPGVVVDVQEVDLFNLLKLNHLHQLHRFPPLSIVEVHLPVHLPRLLLLTRALLIQRQLQETFFTARNG
ncbi:unnamed protein product, partial [Linum tenue]